MYGKNFWITILALAFVFGLSGATFAQGRGGQSGRTQTAGRGNQDRDRTMDTTRDRDGDRDQTRDRNRDLSGDRDRIRANDQQRDQLRDGINSADRVRQQNRDMVRDCDNPNFSSSDAQMHQQRIRNQVKSMGQNQDRLIAGLNDQQRNRFEKNIRTMEQIRSRVDNQLQSMGQRTNGQSFDAKLHKNQLREIDKSMKQWQKQYRQIERDMLGY